MQYSAIDDRVVMGPADQLGDFFGFDKAVEAVHRSDTRLNVRVAAYMRA
jgi:hypothetical protein